MISISQLFELSTRAKSTLKESGKLIGSGVALGLSGVGKVADQAGQSIYKSVNYPYPKGIGAWSTQTISVQQC